MKKYVLISILAVLGVLAAAVPAGQTAYTAYISKYSGIAVSEMYRSGVPASITLAQGLLESRAGLSVLATEGNNHFGIKCHDWKGKKMYADDDRKGECFRVYSDAEASFRDHSDFLRFRDRYKFLFENRPGDYKAWAYGLKKAGYATDPAYPGKLIKLIEDYRLYEFDTMTEEQAAEVSSAVEKQEKPASKPKKPASKPKKVKKALPPSPMSVEQPVRSGRKKGSESFSFSLSRELYSQNGVPFIYAAEGEDLRTIAEANKLFYKEILRYNDMSDGEVLLPGAVVYLQPKKKQAARGIDKFIVDKEGETLWAISQRYGVKLSSLLKMNGMDAGAVLREGDTILLRKPSKR